MRQSTCFWKEFHIFYVKVGIHAQVRTGNLDIIPAGSMAVFMAAWRSMVFRSEIRHFSRSSWSSGVERQFSEPSMAKSSLLSRAPLPIKQRFVNIHLWTSLSACQKQQQQAFWSTGVLSPCFLVRRPLIEPWREVMADRDSAAKRRRDRRLRMHRHEQLTLRMALEAALHHSRDVGPVTYNALRRKRTARAEATNNALRSQNNSVAGDTEFFSLYEEELGSRQAEERRVQVQRARQDQELVELALLLRVRLEMEQRILVQERQLTSGTASCDVPTRSARRDSCSCRQCTRRRLSRRLRAEQLPPPT